MRLVRFRYGGRENLGVETDKGIVDVTVALGSYLGSRGEGDPFGFAARVLPGDLKSLIAGGPDPLQMVATALESLQAVDFVVDERVSAGRKLVYAEDEVRIRAPLTDPSKLVAIGLNYADHAAESKLEVPKQPVFFSKYPNSIVGPGDAIILPDESITREVDYEVELAVIMGRRAKQVQAKDALDYVFGYTICNDVSARDLQFQDGQWVKGKALDTFAPLGPRVVTRDELDVANIGIYLDLNGKRMQESRTEHMLFKVPELIAYLSSLFTLEPGDIISTGTPPGVGFARDPKVFLKPGDEVVCGVEGIGELKNVVSR